MKLLRYALAVLALCLLTVSAQAAARFAVCATTCTWDASSTAMWSASSGGATGASVPGSADTVTFDAATCVGGTTCTTTVNTNPTIQSLTFGACTASTTGCIIDFSTYNNNVNIVNSGATSLLSGTGTGTRTLNMGSGTWTVGSNSSTTTASVNFLTTTGLTFSGASAPLVIVGGPFSPNQLFFGGKSWGALTITGSATYPSTQFQIESGNSVNNTFASLTINAPAYILIRTVSTQTFTGGITVSGASWSAPIYLGSDGASATFNQVTLAVGSASSFGFAALRNVTGATSAITCNPCVNLGSNDGTVTITNPGTGGGGGFIIGGG